LLFWSTPKQSSIPLTAVLGKFQIALLLPDALQEEARFIGSNIITAQLADAEIRSERARQANTRIYFDV
jgi:hypothetical protein